MNLLKWVTNMGDPNGVRRKITDPVDAIFEPEVHEWRNSLIIGDPKATDKYSVEELKAQGVVGGYKINEPEEEKKGWLEKLFGSPDK